MRGSLKKALKQAFKEAFKQALKQAHKQALKRTLSDGVQYRYSSEDCSLEAVKIGIGPSPAASCI